MIINKRVIASPTPTLLDPIQYVRIKGEIYVGTENESDITGRCGVMDGEITSQVEENKMPTKDVSSTGMTLVCTQSGGKPVGEIIIGTPYVIEQKIDDESETSPNTSKLYYAYFKL